MTDSAVTIVVPTVGRASLSVLLASIAASKGPQVAEIVVVDDRPRTGPLELLGGAIRIVHSGGRGPAAARNLGWRSAKTEWIAFLDDDVVVSPTWAADLEHDLSALPEQVAGSQGRVAVPLPTSRRPTDWERSTAGLAGAQWITADMAYRRSALQMVGGFDERFPRAYREDSDLALRMLDAGYALVAGRRQVVHPVRSVDRWVSVRTQAGNADDALMSRLHGPKWRDRAGTPKGRRSKHCAVTLAGLVAVVGVAARRPIVAALGACGWLVGTADLAWTRIAPGPRSRDEVVTMALTSSVIPPAAVWHSAMGLFRHRAARPWSALPDAVLFDRDGTLVVDVPYNADPARVVPVPGARAALDRLRSAGVPVGVVTNQSGIGRGLLSRDQVEAVNARIEDLLGPFDVWQVCPHDVDAGCACRKPAPGMVRQACVALGAAAARTVLVGDIGSDIDAAESAGAVGILVPTAATRPAEVAAAARRVTDLAEATDLILQGAW